MRPFHYDTCPYCHKPTEFDHWYGYRGSDELEDAFEIEYSNSFEPFYLANTHTAPLHDERFKAYGFDRISQVHEQGSVIFNSTESSDLRNACKRVHFLRAEQCFYHP